MFLVKALFDFLTKGAQDEQVAKDVANWRDLRIEYLWDECVAMSQRLNAYVRIYEVAQKVDDELSMTQARNAWEQLKPIFDSALAEHDLLVAEACWELPVAVSH